MINHLPDLKDKIVFFDFDGVLGTYQATKDKVHICEDEYVIGHVLGNQAFNYTRAPKTMQKLVAGLNPDNMYVLSATASSFEEANKIEFLTNNYAEIKKENIIFVGQSDYKVLVMETLYMKMEAMRYRPKSDFVLIEDTIDVIKSVEKAGFKCYHISSFLE